MFNLKLHKAESTPPAAAATAPPAEAWGDIYTMPASYRSSGLTGGGSGGKRWLWWVLLGVIVVAGLGVGLYYWLLPASEPVPQPEAPVSEQPITPQPEPLPPQPEVPATTPQERDRTRYRDIRNIQTALELYHEDTKLYPLAPAPVILGVSSAGIFSSLGFGSLSQGVVYLEQVPGNPEPGGIPYRYESADGTTYALVFSLEAGTAGLTPGEHRATPAGFDGVPSFPITPPPVKTIQPPPPTADQDEDGLTDAEEVILGSDSNKPDTDGDGYLDGAEVQAGFDPVKGQGALLTESSALDNFVSARYGYAIRYPKTWVAKATDAEESEVIISSGDEFIEVVVTANSEHLTASDWYAKQAPGLTPAEVPTETVGSFTWAIATDGLTAYLATDQYLFTVGYNIATKTQASYYTLFRALVRTFSLNTEPATAPESGGTQPPPVQP